MPQGGRLVLFVKQWNHGHPNRYNLERHGLCNTAKSFDLLAPAKLEQRRRPDLLEEQSYPWAHRPGSPRACKRDLREASGILKKFAQKQTQAQLAVFNLACQCLPLLFEAHGRRAKGTGEGLKKLPESNDNNGLAGISLINTTWQRLFGGSYERNLIMYCVLCIRWCQDAIANGNVVIWQVPTSKKMYFMSMTGLHLGGCLQEPVEVRKGRRITWNWKFK